MPPFFSRLTAARIDNAPSIFFTISSVPQVSDSTLEEVYRSDWGRIVATVIRQVGDFEIAEEAVQEAFAAAVNQWRSDGIPASPRAWLIQTARHKAVDHIRRRSLHKHKVEEDVGSWFSASIEEPDYDTVEIPDDRLRLIFTCCHPALALDAQVALTLRTLGGLETDEIARAFLVPTATMAQRLVRAKRKIRDAGIPYVVPGAQDMPERLEAVLTAIYLIFNEGYASTRGWPHVRTDLCGEAMRLARLVRNLMAPQPPAEVTGLLALMLLHDARREARLDTAGDLILLDEQDRTRWDRRQIAEALPLVEEAVQAGAGPFTIQAAIAAEHCRAARASDTNWARILHLYDLLETMQASPIVSLNRAVAVAMVEGPGRALALIDELSSTGDLDHYHLLHATRADMLRRMSLKADAREAYSKALALVTNDSERRFLERRLREVQE